MLPGQGDQKQTSQGQLGIGTGQRREQKPVGRGRSGGGGSSGDLLRETWLSWLAFTFFPFLLAETGLILTLEFCLPLTASLRQHSISPPASQDRHPLPQHWLFPLNIHNRSNLSHSKEIKREREGGRHSSPPVNFL